MIPWRDYFVFGSVLVMVAFSGCAGLGSAPTSPMRIAVPILDNATGEPALDRQFTAALKEELIATAGFSVVDNADTADARLEGRLVSVDTRPVALNSLGQAAIYRVNVRVEVVVRKVPESTLLWKDGAFETWAEYRVTPDVAGTRDARDRALREAARQFGERIAARLSAVGFAPEVR